MKKIFSIFLVYASMWGNTAFAEFEPDTDKLTETINYLLSFVENSECIFIRNDNEHTAKAAAAHMKRKYEHFEGEIRTPEDFIRLAATKSLITGKPYLVKFKTGKVIKSETWLSQALEMYREEQN
jgi:hypothetical protein